LLNNKKLEEKKWWVGLGGRILIEPMSIAKHQWASRDLEAAILTLLNITSTQNGSVVPDLIYGTASAGVLEYTSTGYMSTILIATTPDLRPKGLIIPAEPDQSNISWEIIGQRTLAYAGPFQFHNAFSGTNATHE
jgi:hypothetical protein